MPLKSRKADGLDPDDGSDDGSDDDSDDDPDGDGGVFSNGKRCLWPSG
jgi:hypothetical protein